MKIVSEIIKNSITSIGGVYRYGGDEFVVLLVDVEPKTIEAIVEKIGSTVEERKLKNRDTEMGMLTVSQGYIVLESNESSDIWQVLPYADKQLYMVKNNGKKGYSIIHEKI